MKLRGSERKKSVSHLRSLDDRTWTRRDSKEVNIALAIQKIRSSGGPYSHPEKIQHTKEVK